MWKRAGGPAAKSAAPAHVGETGGPGHNFVLWVAGKRPHSALDCPAENQTTTTTFLASWFVWLASLHTLSLCVCVCVDTRRGAGSGLAKQKIRKKKSRRKRPIPVYTGHNQCRSHLQHERLLAFRSSFFRQFLSFHYYYLLFDHRRRPFIFEKKNKQIFKKKNKWRNEDLRRTNKVSLLFCGSVNFCRSLSIKRRASFRNNRHSFYSWTPHPFLFPDNLFSFAPADLHPSYIIEVISINPYFLSHPRTQQQTNQTLILLSSILYPAAVLLLLLLLFFVVDVKDYQLENVVTVTFRWLFITLYISPVPFIDPIYRQRILLLHTVWYIEIAFWKLRRPFVSGVVNAWFSPESFSLLDWIWWGPYMSTHLCVYVHIVRSLSVPNTEVKK